MNEATKRLLGFLGLCRKAGKLIIGTPLVCEALGARTKPHLVLVCAYASPATRKKLQTKTAYYGVTLRMPALDPEELAHAVGKTGAVAALAVTDPGMAAALLSRIDAAEQTEAPISTGKEPSAREGKDA